MNFLKRLFGVFKCAFCSRKHCSVRYQLGSRSYHSRLGFVRVTCPKKKGEYGYVPTVSEICARIKEKILGKQDKEK